MTITKEGGGFNRATVVSEYGSELRAKLSVKESSFNISFDYKFEGGWFFDQASCREASEFFIMLADELARREEDKDGS